MNHEQAELVISRTVVMFHEHPVKHSQYQKQDGQPGRTAAVTPAQIQMLAGDQHAANEHDQEDRNDDKGERLVPAALGRLLLSHGLIPGIDSFEVDRLAMERCRLDM